MIYVSVDVLPSTLNRHILLVIMSLGLVCIDSVYRYWKDRVGVGLKEERKQLFVKLRLRLFIIWRISLERGRIIMHKKNIVIAFDSLLRL